MSLKEEWYAARQQREQKLRERQQQVLQKRQQIQAERAALHQQQRTTLSQFYQNLATETEEFLSGTTARRTAMAAAQNNSLNHFHSNLQANTATFLEETRSHYSQVWLEQAQKRSTSVALIRDYIWGTTPSPETPATDPLPVQPSIPAPAVVPVNLKRVYQFLQQNAGARPSQIETALGLSRVETVNVLQNLINQKRVVQKDQGYFISRGS